MAEPTLLSLTEPELIQNPALCSYTLWHFGLGFQSDHQYPALLPFAFLVLPLVLHRPTLDLIVSTRKTSGLALFAAKLSEERENLLAVHERARLLRTLTFQSIAFGINSRLLSLNYQQATLRSNELESGRKAPPTPERVKNFPSAAERLGYWFSKAGLPQTAITLGIQF